MYEVHNVIVFAITALRKQQYLIPYVGVCKLTTQKITGGLICWPSHIQSQSEAFVNSKDDQRSSLLEIKLVFLFIMFSVKKINYNFD